MYQCIAHLDISKHLIKNTLNRHFVLSQYLLDVKLVRLYGSIKTRELEEYGKSSNDILKPNFGNHYTEYRTIEKREIRRKD